MDSVYKIGERYFKNLLKSRIDWFLVKLETIVLEHYTQQFMILLFRFSFLEMFEVNSLQKFSLENQKKI